MKTLLNKKGAIAFTFMVCVVSLKAQIPDQLQKLPAFRMRATMLASLHKPQSARQLDVMKCSANAPCLIAQTTLGGRNYDQGNKLIPTRDGGFIVCGQSLSADGDFHTTDTINGDAYLAKYNKFRQLEWTKTYGGSGFDVFNDVVQTADGGYAAVGQTGSNDGDVSGNHGSNDVWLVKCNSSGSIEWQKCYGGTGDEFGNAIVQSIFGGYAIATFTNSNDNDVSGNHNTDGNFDGWFLEVGPRGKLLVQHCYGGSDFDGFFSMVPSDFGSYVLYGASSSVNGDVSGNHGGGDAWVVKINALGKIIWQKTVGGSGAESTGANEIARTADGNIVIDGYSSSTDGDINAKNDTVVSFSAKLNSRTGAIIWSKSYADPRYRAGSGIFATKDGGAVETGVASTDVFDGGTYDVLVSKFDRNGNEEWYKRLGGSDFDAGVIGYETLNGDLNILCQTASTDGDVKNVHGNIDVWIIKLGHCGDIRSDNDVMPDNLPEKVERSTTTILSAYPNPVSTMTTISFNLPQAQNVAVTIYDMNGKLIRRLADGQMQAGNHQLTWNTTDENIVTGVYLVKFETVNNVETKKVFVVK